MGKSDKKNLTPPVGTPLRRRRGAGGEVLPRIKSLNPQILIAARQLRQQQTPAEQILWSCLRNRRLGGIKFKRQHPLGRFVADFYCHEAGLVIELDGAIHLERDQAERAGRLELLRCIEVVLRCNLPRVVRHQHRRAGGRRSALPQQHSKSLIVLQELLRDAPHRLRVVGKRYLHVAENDEVLPDLERDVRRHRVAIRQLVFCPVPVHHVISERLRLLVPAKLMDERQDGPHGVLVRVDGVDDRLGIGRERVVGLALHLAASVRGAIEELGCAHVLVDVAAQACHRALGCAKLRHEEHPRR